MAAKLIKGAEVAAQIREELKKEVEELKAKHNITPGLVTILVGQDPGSVSYVTAKQKTSHELGFYSIQDTQPADITEAALLALFAGALGISLAAFFVYLFQNSITHSLGMPFLFPDFLSLMVLFIGGVAFAIVTVTLAAFMPAWRISRAEPAVAMRE